MIILPDRNIPRARFLMPVKASEWRAPSQALPKDQFGNKNQTRFRLTARLHDGFAVWRGWFDDRDDADAFLFAIALGSLQQQPDLWRLPTPQWHPDLGEDFAFEFATVTFLTTTGAGSYSTPSDWNASNNTVETLSGGASGISAGSGNRSSGGGASYSAQTNISISGSVSYTVGAGGAGVLSTKTGNAGGDTWFNGASLAASSVGSKGPAAVSASSAPGGVAASGVGATKYSGGAGRAAVGAANAGAGGAAGPAGAGGAGSGTAGGSANNGTTAGPTAGSAGNAGTEWDATHGCGTGAFEVWGSVPNPAYAGGRYGGGGSLTGSTGTSGAGYQGLIVVTYTPVVSLIWIPSRPFQHMILR